MPLFGPSMCPNCGLPVPSGALACHYCRKTLPQSSRWGFGSWIIGAALVFLLVSTFGPENVFGGRVAETLQGFMPGR